ADGMLIGEGVGMIVLKRLSDAERDGDRIYAVIKGIGTSSDGRFKSVYAPRSSGQAMAMNRAYEDAQYAPSTVGLVEAHGTGTGAGDPTEFESMRMVFAQDNDQLQHIALGSVKSQIGHTKAAAGAAGMIKTILALHHKVLPPTINVDEPNPKFNIEQTPIYINTEARPWIANSDYPRRASVSAFGFGGINVHIALEEYQGEVEQAYRVHQPFKTVVIKAANTEVLLTRCQELVKSLSAEDAEGNWQQLCAESTQVITESEARIGFVVSTIEEAIAHLQLVLNNAQSLRQSTGGWQHPKGIWYRGRGLDTKGKTVALFSGQGSQYVGMGAELTNAFPPVRAAFTLANEVAKEESESSISERVFPTPAFSAEAKQQQQTTLTQTQFAQPAIGALSMGMYKVLQAAGFNADFAAGHSFGELTALWAANVYDDVTFLTLARARGNAMAQRSPNSDAGVMVAVKASEEVVSAVIAGIDNVVVANINSTSQVVLGGGKVAMQAAVAKLEAQQLRVIPLPVSAAFHTQYVAHAQLPFAEVVQAQKFRAAKIPVYANGTGKPYPVTTTAIKKRLGEQILNPVRFRDQIENIYAAGGRVFVEFGPKGVLTNLVRDILKGKDFTAIALNPNASRNSDLQFRQAEVQLRVAGLQLGQIDPYQVDQAAPTKPAKLSVQLGGHNYVSPATEKAYAAALTDGRKIQGSTVKIVEKIIEKPIVKEVEKIVEVPVAPLAVTDKTEEEMLNRELIQLFSQTLEHLKAQQSQSLEAFQKLMSDQQKQSQQLLEMLHNLAAAPTSGSQPLSTPASTPSIRTAPAPAPVVAVPTPNGKSNGNGHHVETASVVAATATATVVSPAPAVATAEATMTSPGLSNEQLANILLTVVSEKTGYPAEMLELNMDMEADLGIDSIKRVEIFGAMTEQYPEVSGINPQELTELRTLGQIVDYIGQKAGGNAAVAAPAPAPQPVAQAAPAASAPSAGLSNEQLANILLTVVSEKTGYPAEMLELGMD
ncbi:MAG: acyltransferase domain-containing protein, partial [Bacteroidota bacterium]